MCQHLDFKKFYQRDIFLSFFVISINKFLTWIISALKKTEVKIQKILNF